MAPSVIDWSFALSTATRLVKPGPAISAAGAQAVVAALREHAVRAEAYVTEVTGLTAPSGTAPVLVVDRPRWIEANLAGFRQVLAPLTEAAATKLRTSPAGAWVGSRVTGAEVGVLLSYLAPKVLGQFDPFFEPAGGSADPGLTRPGGRLLLVAPNIVSVERELDVVPADFRLWVCLHEETHRVQFTAVPWLRGYLNAQVDELVSSTDLEPGVLAEMVASAVRRLAGAIRTREDISILDLIQRPAQRAVLDRITGVMSLLEGHADVVMDSVGPEVIPTVEQIRRKFNVRRRGRGVDRLVRKLLGLDAKMRQYSEGAAFCRRVIAAVGMDGFNRVWTSPDTLPSREEITQPERWLARVHPEAPAAVA